MSLCALCDCVPLALRLYRRPLIPFKVNAKSSSLQRPICGCVLPQNRERHLPYTSLSAQCVFAHRLAVDAEKPARFRDAAFPIVGYVGAGFAEIHIGLYFFKFCDINFLTSRLVADLGGYHFPSALYKSCDVAVKLFLSAVDEFLAVRGHIQNGAIPGNALAKSSSTFLPINIAS